MTDSNHANLIEQYFDQHAQSWHDYYQRISSTVNMVLIDRKNIAIDLLQGRLSSGARVLDAGCGAGIAALDMAAKGHFVEGVDIAENMIALASENLAGSGLPEGRCTFRVGNVLEEPDLPPEDRYDCLLALGFIQYQVDEVEALKKLSQLLKPGGWMVISGPTRVKLTDYFGLFGFMDRDKAPIPNHELLETISVHNYSPGRFRDILARSGFVFAGYRGHGFTRFRFISNRLGLRAQIRLHRLFTSLARILPLQQFANDIVVLARLPE